MIYDFALHPELVASWHDRKRAYPFMSQLGQGQRRVACQFPDGNWEALVLAALAAMFPDKESAAWQTARKNIEVLLQRLRQQATRRGGAASSAQAWSTAAIAEHRSHPFGGIVVPTSDITASYLVAADALDEDCAAWHPPELLVPRTATALAEAVEPLVRAARHIRFVDPYFDPTQPRFLATITEFLKRAQKRKRPADVRIEVHLSVTDAQVRNAQAKGSRGASPTKATLASTRLAACATKLTPLLACGVGLEVFVWEERPGGEQIHNRYVLTEVGGVLLPAGLDEGKGSATDDLAILSRERLLHRLEQYRRGSTLMKLVGSSKLVGVLRGAPAW